MKTRLLRRWQNRLAFICLTLTLFAFPLTTVAGGWTDLWLTPDQQGQALFRQERYLEAAETFEALEWKGAAYFRGGDFESAASVFGRVRSPEAAFNRGNALVMLGRYDEAIQSYETALEDRPDWPEAQQNLALAQIRQARLAPPGDDAGGTGGQLEADEIVFDDTGRVNKAGSETETEGGQAMSDDEMRAVWLRRVQNDPAEFLRARFSYQLYQQTQEQKESGDEP